MAALASAVEAVGIPPPQLLHRLTSSPRLVARAPDARTCTVL